ncbi:MAG: signal peptidase I [Ruminococcus sp.]|nr:signal peptidase I [Ruminococcus sp.]
MREDFSSKYDDELDNDFSDTDIALDMDDESAKTVSKSKKFDDNFQEEFKAAFEEVPESKSKRKNKLQKKTAANPNAVRFQAVNSEGLTAGIYDWIRCVIFAIAIVVVCLTFVFRLVEVDGTSMDDTLQNKDKVIVTNLFYTPHDSDIVVISHGEKYDKPIIKRVIATEGQSLKLDYDNDRIIVDGVVIPESYIKGSTFANNKGDNQVPDVIPKGKIFVMGDNRQVSLDSRSTEIGLIDVSNVIGKAQVVAFPFDRIKYLY